MVLWLWSCIDWINPTLWHPLSLVTAICGVGKHNSDSYQASESTAHNLGSAVRQDLHQATQGHSFIHLGLLALSQPELLGLFKSEHRQLQKLSIPAESHLCPQV